MEKADLFVVVSYRKSMGFNRTCHAVFVYFNVSLVRRVTSVMAKTTTRKLPKIKKVGKPGILLGDRRNTNNILVKND